jgi:hypothetical protein
MLEPRIEDATPDDLRLAIEAVGPDKARYGGLLSCALAGIYAERARAKELIKPPEKREYGPDVHESVIMERLVGRRWRAPRGENTGG